jgi:LPS-assembly protein
MRDDFFQFFGGPRLYLAFLSTGLWLVVFGMASNLVFSNIVAAQVEPPTNQFLFLEDSERYIQQEEGRKKRVLQPMRKTNQDIDFQAPEVRYNSEDSAFEGSGGVVIATPDLLVQADSARFFPDDQRAELEGDVLIARPDGNFEAQSAELDFQSETGTFSDFQFFLGEDNYRVAAEQGEKLSEFEYHLETAQFSTCACADGKNSWEIRCNTADVTDGGMAYGYGSTLALWGVPVLYSPVVAFPVLRERTTGLLFPRFGYDSENGMYFQQPLYIVLDDHSDLTVTPFTETQTRYGSSLDYRHRISERHSIDGKLLYSNERPREDDLRGTNTIGIFDPSIDDDRFGGFYRHIWQSPTDWDVPLGFFSDVRLVGDSLLLREIEDTDIGLRTARYLTSNAVLRAGLSDSTSAELGVEYNQAFETDEDLIFQRLPQLSVDHLSSYRPFGVNPLGASLKARGQLQLTRFDRQQGYDGTRADFAPTISMPLRFKNYVRSELQLGYRLTGYELDALEDPVSGDSLTSSNDRGLLNVRYATSTGVERIYDIDEGSAFASLLRYGAKNQDMVLRRVKHLIEPRVSFTYVPERDQSDLPFFDSIDRLRGRELFSYGVRTSLIGSFRSASATTEPIEALAPELDELPLIRPLDEYDPFAPSLGYQVEQANRLRQARRIRELGYLELLQTYDYLEDRRDSDPDRRALSDLGLNFGMSPTPDFGLEFNTNYGIEDADISSWRVATHFNSDRGDRLRLRYSYVDEAVSQLEGNLEVRLNPRFGLGYYTRFDELENDFIENLIALRVRSACNCWHLDLGYSDQINPDRQRVLVNFTFKGIGDITQFLNFDDLRRERDQS